MVAVALLWLALVQGQGAPRSRAVPGKQMQPAQPDAPASSRPIERPRAAQTRLRAAPGAQSGGPGTSGGDDDPLSPAAIERERQQFLSYFGGLDAQRAAEQPDVRLHDQVSARVAQVMKDEELLQDSTILSIDCGSTLCRIEATHQSTLAKRMFSNVFALKVGALLPEATLYAEPGAMRSVAHFARDGAQLPRIRLDHATELVEGSQP